MAGHRIFKTSVASVYPHCVTRAEKRGRTKDELDEILCWLTGYARTELHEQIAAGADFETFFAEARRSTPGAS
jgi:hypothetical protein